MAETALIDFYGKLGWMGLPLLLTSVVALALAAERAWFFWKWRSRTAEVRRQVQGCLDSEVPEKSSCFEALERLMSPLAGVAKAYLLHRESESGIRKTVTENAFEGWRTRARGPIKSLGMLAQIAPLLGLTGTVLGLVRAFQVIEKSDTAISPELLAGGIWEALLTTVVGMLISIPLIILIRIYHGQLERVVREVKDLYSWLEEQRARGQWAKGVQLLEKEPELQSEQV